MGVYSRIQRTLKALTNQADKPSEAANLRASEAQDLQWELRNRPLMGLDKLQRLGQPKWEQKK